MPYLRCGLTFTPRLYNEILLWGRFNRFLLSFGAVLTESEAVLDWGRFRFGPFWLATHLCTGCYLWFKTIQDLLASSQTPLKIFIVLGAVITFSWLWTTWSRGTTILNISILIFHLLLTLFISLHPHIYIILLCFILNNWIVNINYYIVVLSIFILYYNNMLYKLKQGYFAFTYGRFTKKYREEKDV